MLPVDDAPASEPSDEAAPTPVLPARTVNQDTTSVLNWVAVVVAVGALVLGFFALGRNGGGGASAAGAERTIVEVTLTEFAIEPNHLMVPPGPVTLRVTNQGAIAHNLVVDGKSTRDLNAGETQDLDLGTLSVGEYKMWCEIAGHEASGMTGTLMVVAGAAPGEGDGGDHGDDHLHGYATWQEMQTAMDARAMRFVEEDKGTFGGQRLEPEVLADGTKRFTVTAAITDWEIEPGKVVQAWTYNGVVPGPEIHVEVGDRVQVLLKNELPQATVIHWHGIDVPNVMDGVPPFTQDAVAPGDEFLYEFTAKSPAVGIYHGHNGADQVLNGLFAAVTIGEMPTPDVLVERGFAETPSQSINMVLNDAGVIGLTLNGKSFPATEAYTGKVGDTILVNYYNEGLMPHPMHLHQPLGWIIAKDGEPLLQPIPGDTINVAPGERYTVLYKLTEPGVWAWHCHILTHAEGPDGMFGMVTAFIVSE
ncbi:MAG TPA: multicopper oxidase domain-containing protein [Ilumatobacter sp.]|nr:multicopper oxidase domain-containing protein [Ilumatobacter sp.]